MKRKLMILANRDLTSDLIFGVVCEDPRVEICCVGLSTSVVSGRSFWRGVLEVFSRSGFRYFCYVSFVNGILFLREGLYRWCSRIGHPGKGFSGLRVWAETHRVEVIQSADFNSARFVECIVRHQPEVIFSRVDQILSNEVLESTRYGCWCFHSSMLPSYQGIAAEFHSLLNGEERIGFSVMKMTTKLDGGPIVVQKDMSIESGLTLHGLIMRNNMLGREVLRLAVDRWLEESIEFRRQPNGGNYCSWPSSADTLSFRKKGLRYISFREIAAHLSGIGRFS